MPTSRTDFPVSLLQNSIASILESYPYGQVNSFWLIERRVASNQRAKRATFPCGTVLSGLLHKCVEHFPSCTTIHLASNSEAEVSYALKSMEELRKTEFSLEVASYKVPGDWYQWAYEWMFLGVSRAPGLVVLETTDKDSLAKVEILLETALLRRFCVLLCSESCQEKRFLSRLNACVDEVTSHLKLSSAHLLLPGKEENRDFGLWALAPSLEGHHQVWRRLQSGWASVLGERAYKTYFRNKVVVTPQAKREQEEASHRKEEILIEEASEEDLLEVIELWESLMDEHSEWDSHFQRHSNARFHLQLSLRQQLHQPDHGLFVARHDRLVVGFLSAQQVRSPLFAEARSGHLLDLFVYREFRRQGIGKRLVKSSLEWFQKQGILRVEVNVARQNPVGQDFWKSIGFKPYLHVFTYQLT